MSKNKLSILPSIIGEIIGAFIALFVNNSLVFWNLPFIVNSKFLIYLPIANACVLLNLSLNLMKSATHGSLVSLLFKLLTHVVSFISLYCLINIFPFNFSQIINYQFNDLFGLILALAAFGFLVAFIVDLLKILFYRK